ncbi:MAG: M1 family metallopeptidase [Hyphomonadaceae bacterium]|nr:M1 family metallopeptidase [Hyphomonadaceae bacterium]
MRLMPLRALAPLFAIAAALLFTGPAAAQYPTQRQEFGDEAIPSRYDIAIVPDIEAATFTGTVRIAVTTPAPLQSLTLNAADLAFQRVTIDGRRATAAFDEAAQTATLSTGRPIPAGDHVVEIAYRGKIYDEAYGLFRTSYTADGAQKHMLVTQFEPGDARRFAPMWDQPNRRAVFALTVTYPSSLSAIGNMPAAETTQLRGGKTRVRFADSPSMPSYLLFLGVGDIERITQNVDGVELGVVTRRGATERGRYALQAGAESLRYFTQYFGIPYPLPKLDMLAVPGAGGFGAMENWGAILYFENRLLIDDATSNEGNRQDVFATVAHEVAHQWFGNLVTMRWWDDLWLNEAFASWMEAKAKSVLHPDWQGWLTSAAEGDHAMDMDSRSGTHPIVQRVDTLDQANLAFDEITYLKGQAIIRMFEVFAGEEGFRNGVRNYINSRRYGSAQTEDLWRAIEGASSAPVVTVARSFTTQMGVPVVRVSSATCGRRDRVTRITLTQERFADDEAARTNEQWTIPIAAQPLGGAVVQALMQPGQPLTMELPGRCIPVRVNAGQTAYMRVLYADADFDRLAARFRELPVADQLGTLQDYWAFGRAGYAPLSDYFELARAAPADSDPAIGLQIANALEDLWLMENGRPERAQVASFARSILKPMFDRVGWDARAGEAPNVGLVRDKLIRTLGRLGDEGVVAEARRRIEANDPALLPGGIREATLRAYGSQARAQDYERLLTMARAATDFTEQRRLYFALAEAQDAGLADRTLVFALGDTVPRQLRPRVLAAVGIWHPRRAWDFLVAHRAEVDALLDPLQRQTFAPEVAQLAADPAVAAGIEAYAQSFPAESRQAAVTAAAAIRAKARVVQERAPASAAWLAANAGSP